MEGNRVSIVDCVIVGGGLTGLSIAHLLRQRGLEVRVVEQLNRLGGAIETYRRDGFVYEAGPTTGIISKAEVAELFDSLGVDGLMTLANASARRRLIYRSGRFRPLPSGLWSAVMTPLFSWRDKLRIMGEPWRSRGTNSNETVAQLVRRRLGKSFYTYAVDPFIGGIYAGDPEQLVTRHALPRLYALEQKHGSFVGGAMALARTPRTARERRATKQIFSTRLGLSSLINALTESIGRASIILSANVTSAAPSDDGRWRVDVNSSEDGVERQQSFMSRWVISTISPQGLLDLVPQAPAELMGALCSMRYAPVVQVAVGYRDGSGIDLDAFGGLVPSVEDRELLGILNPSAGFADRAPEGGMLLSVFLGGMREPTVIDRDDEAIQRLVLDKLSTMLSVTRVPDLMHIFRHRRGIPQYEASTDARLSAIGRLEQIYPGLIIAGNMHGGIGMADRIAQAYAVVERITGVVGIR